VRKKGSQASFRFPDLATFLQALRPLTAPQWTITRALLSKSADASVAAAAKRRHRTTLAKVLRPCWVNMVDQNAGERDVAQLFSPDSTLGRPATAEAADERPRTAKRQVAVAKVSVFLERPYTCPSSLAANAFDQH